MISLEGSQVILGFICAAVAALFSITRQRRFTHSDTGLCLGAFTAGFNIPVAIFLCCYFFMDDPPLTQTKLHVVSKYIPLAGLSLLLAASVGLSTVLQAAWKKPTTA
jgi:phosphatidylserine synthase